MPVKAAAGAESQGVSTSAEWATPLGCDGVIWESIRARGSLRLRPEAQY
jgi:hypothetical protein